MIELKPCPFCGKKVEWYSGAIECKTCGLRFRPYGSSKESCDRQWNKRAYEHCDNKKGIEKLTI